MRRRAMIWICIVETGYLSQKPPEHAEGGTDASPDGRAGFAHLLPPVACRSSRGGGRRDGIMTSAHWELYREGENRTPPLRGLRSR